MNKRKFLSCLLLLPCIGCIHWPGIDNKKKRTFKVGAKVLVIQPLRKNRNFDFGPGYIHSPKHPLDTWCVRFDKGPTYKEYIKAGGILSEKDFNHREWMQGRVLFGHYAEEELVLL